MIANSHLALAAAEFAKDCGRFDDFHRRVFQAYYQEDRNIGDKAVLLEIAGSSGLDTDELAKALDERRYEGRFEEVRREIEEFGITAAPTFFVDNRYLVVGAQPYSVFKHAIERIVKKRRENEL